ncbi:Peptide deformylase 1A, chloroplastic/mitochondrial [Rhizophlyctis rosea]|uniref:Peptide deformylase n=1 Tax=Rhizophlyctis rosea TaxID=64517 RepID=A0AAD5S841_9FUNG|nr:Peptide deformylase 1A, chloroplastic/mitochondrial [Rhizophlyctis rosea]
MPIIQKLTGVFKKPTPILRAGHPTLRIKALPVKPTELKSYQFQDVVRQMTRAFESAYTPTIGLSAPQIGHPMRLIAYRIEDPKYLKEHKIEPVPLTFIVNPTLKVLSSQTSTDYETCESVPSYNALVKRATEVKVDGLDLEGKEITVNAKGVVARVLQHEVDHLDGLLYVDKMEPRSMRHDKYIDKYELRSQ